MSLLRYTGSAIQCHLRNRNPPLTRQPQTLRGPSTSSCTLDHPFKKEIEAIRASILGADRTIAEGVKWKAPSFRTSEYFATTNLREKAGIGIILHLGAKMRTVQSGGVVIDDPAKLLKWLGKDRAMIVFKSPEDFSAKKAAFERIIRQWIIHV